MFGQLLIKLSVLIPLLLFTLAEVDNNFNFDVKVDSNSGKFRVFINDDEWFRSGETFIIANGVKHSTTGSLFVKAISEFTGEDVLGTYEGTNIHFVARTDASVEMVGSVRKYKGSNNIVFEQSYPNALSNTSSDNADSLVSSFPSFELFENNGCSRTARDRRGTVLGYSHWISWFYEKQPSFSSSAAAAAAPSNERRRALVAPGFASPQFGVWDDNTKLSGGMGGSGVTAIYAINTGGSSSHSLRREAPEDAVAVVLAPLTNVLAVSHISPDSGSVQYGIMGNVSSIPAMYSVSVMMHIGNQGVNKAMSSWGTQFRRWYNKADAAAAREKDITLQYLGFSTDNGAYYYYNTAPGMDYEQTLISVKKDADAKGIPYRYVLLDSWWYYRGANGGVSDWSPRPEIFPNGIEALYQATGWLVQAHNRYWAEDTTYAVQNGGKYKFIIDTVKHGSVPAEQSFWDDLFAYPKAAWGLRVYEQDWMFNEMFEYVGDMLTSVDLARTWLLQMGRGASKAGLTIQYCMPFIRHMLQSAEVPAVTQTRASDDYVVSPYEGVDNWRIAGQSMLIEAVGLAASKDGFWTSTYQPGNPYGEERYEPNPRLHAAVASLSAGPVQIADGIGYSDAALILRSCMADGRLLQPSATATLIDAVMAQRALSDSPKTSRLPSTSLPPVGAEVWFAPSVLGSRLFGYIFAADLTSAYSVTPRDVDSSISAHQIFRVFESNNTAVTHVFSSQHPLELSVCGQLDFQLWTMAPVETNGWAFQGELNKWIGVSTARFQSLSTVAEPAGLVATARGVEGESLLLGFVDPDGVSVSVSCVFGASGVVTVSSSGGCSQSSQ